MADPWYKDLLDDAFLSDTDKTYEKAVALIRKKLSEGMGFDRACEEIEVEDDNLKRAIIDDMLKVLIAEEYFGRNIPLNYMANKLDISIERLESAKISMTEDVKDASIREFYKSFGKGSSR